MHITFVVNSFSRQPTGGLKIIYQYANHFAERGHTVTIVFCVSNPVAKYEGKVPYAVRYMAQKAIVQKGPRWYPLDNRVKKIYTTAMTAQTIPDGDAVFATAIGTARPVADLPSCKGKKYYLIQDFENWSCSDDEVYATYNLGMTNIPIAKWLADIVQEKTGKEPYYIPNAIDTDLFHVKTENRLRYPHSIAMIYQRGEHKGFQYGYQVCLKLKENYPDLRCHIFGLSKREPEWPQWIKYTENATQEQLVGIYNSVSVFLCSSVEEGFGLCGAESMACGCAFAITGYRGVYTYAKNEENALISPVKDVDALYQNVCRLFDDGELRTRLSQKGRKDIEKMSWNNAFDKMDRLIEGRNT